MTDLLNFEQSIVETTQHVKEFLGNDCAEYDWRHVYRVNKLALHIAKKEGADLLVVTLAALLHDVYDWKFNASSDPKLGAEYAQEWLARFALDKQVINHAVEPYRSYPFV